MEDEEVGSSLFKDLKVYVCGLLDEDTEQGLKEGEGNQRSYLSALVNLVVVGRNPNESELIEAWEIYEDIPVVSQDWIRCSIQARKRVPLQAFSIQSTSLFKGLSFSIAKGDLSQEDINILWELLTFNGAYGVSLELHSSSNYAINTRVVEFKDPLLFHPKLLLKPGEVYISKRQILINQLKEAGISSIASTKANDISPPPPIPSLISTPTVDTETKTPSFLLKDSISQSQQLSHQTISMTLHQRQSPVSNNHPQQQQHGQQQQQRQSPISQMSIPITLQQQQVQQSQQQQQRHAPSPQQTQPTMIQQRVSPMMQMKKPLPNNLSSNQIITVQQSLPVTPTSQTFVHATKSNDTNTVSLQGSSLNTSVEQVQTTTLQHPSTSISRVVNHPPSTMSVSSLLSNSHSPIKSGALSQNHHQKPTQSSCIIRARIYSTDFKCATDFYHRCRHHVATSQSQVLQRAQVQTIQRPIQQVLTQSVQVLPQNQSHVRGGQLIQSSQLAREGQSLQQIQVSQQGQTLEQIKPQQIQIQAGQPLQHVQSIQVPQQQVQITQQGGQTIQHQGQTIRQVQLPPPQGQTLQQQQQGQTLRQVQLSQQGQTLTHVQMPQQIQVTQQGQTGMNQGQTLQVQLPQQVQVSQQQQQGQTIQLSQQAAQSTIQHVHISQQGQTIQVSQQGPNLTRVTPRTLQQGQQLIHTGQIQLQQGQQSQTIRPQQQQQAEIGWQTNQPQQVIQQQTSYSEASTNQHTAATSSDTTTDCTTTSRHSTNYPTKSPGWCRSRAPNTHARQQQIIQQHIAGLSMEQRASFTQMNPREKQQYLAARGLLLPHPTIRHTITLTDQQREMLQNMDGQQRQVFIAKLQKEKEMQIRQQMMQRQQQGMVQQQVMVSQQQQQMWQQQPNQQQQQQPQQQQYRTISHPSDSSIVANNASQPSTQVVSNSQTMRPAWSGEAHPALAQVPRTPQQLQRLQRLQLQREQGGGTIESVAATPVNQQPRVQQQQLVVNDPRPQISQQQLLQQQQSQQTQVIGQPQVQMQQQQTSTSQQQQYMQQIAMHQQQQGNGNQTKVALANMLTNRLQQPGVQQQQQQQQMTPTHHTSSSSYARRSYSISSTTTTTATSISTSTNSRSISSDACTHDESSTATNASSNATTTTTSRTGKLCNTTTKTLLHLNPLNNNNNNSCCCHRRYPSSWWWWASKPSDFVWVEWLLPVSLGGVRMGIPRPGGGGPIHPPRIQFYGHDPKLTLPADLCLLGCIFLVVDYQESDESEFCSGWIRVIKQYGGEIEEDYHPRITHVLCKSQDNPTAQQGLREGKRLVTVYWLNDIVVNKRVTPPWKAIHFPLPINFEKPCENMLLTLTGFEGRNRDWVKQMIRLSGAKYSGYFSKHNHAIICRKASGDKFEKAKEWKVPAVSVQWLNDVLFGNVNAVQCVNNPKYQNLKLEDPFRIDFTLLPHLVEAWKIPIRVTPETYQKFKANPPARIKRKVEKQKQEKEEAAKRMRLESQGGNNLLEPQSISGNIKAPDVNGGESVNQPTNGGAETDKLIKEDEKENNNMSVSESDNNNDSEGMNKSGDDYKKISVLLSGFSSTEFSSMVHLIKEAPFLCYTSDVRVATHLIMPKLCRTISFLKAIVKVKFILSNEWLKESCKEKAPQDELKYLFHDEEFERTFKFSLSTTLTQPERDKLFEGKTFYITPETPPSWKKIKSIVELAGGEVENNRRKDLKQIKELNKPGCDPQYIIITCEPDLHLVTDVLKAKIGVGYNAEFVLTSFSCR
ncbi:PAXIP1 [Lepeophtheirus salmonis]|uniref:PAX-interacting protein 1 n=1 Tax=Lepeophtheirus salmonis TaxID=72036 RepID=A0A7R8CTZ2_LEPSM|nr:PAXIP1 [Lepeophtheirus salmonis]CAF2930139.1 PAXIP1 [Lepeophtheirus salmonis]